MRTRLSVKKIMIVYWLADDAPVIGGQFLLWQEKSPPMDDGSI
ncbi:Hypothetical protein ABZS17G119_02870 [Kosakonia cowanii]